MSEEKLSNVIVKDTTILAQRTKIKGHLLVMCTIMNRIDSLMVAGECMFYYVHHQKKLPEQLVVLEDLDVRGCIFLEGLPSNIAVGGLIIYDRNTSGEAKDHIKTRTRRKYYEG